MLLPGVVALLLVLTGCGAPSAPEPPAGAVVQAPVAADADGMAPTSVRIPAIDVDEPELLRLGIDGDGAAEVPQDYDRVGWFDHDGPGPTVLLGHVDSRSGPAVFYRLRDLAAGDVIEVDRGDGTVGRYTVERTQQVPKDEFPTFEVFGAASGDVLRLVTCAGEFDRGERSYHDNLVVHARAV